MSCLLRFSFGVWNSWVLTDLMHSRLELLFEFSQQPEAVSSRLGVRHLSAEGKYAWRGHSIHMRSGFGVWSVTYLYIQLAWLATTRNEECLKLSFEYLAPKISLSIFTHSLAQFIINALALFKPAGRKDSPENLPPCNQETFPLSLSVLRIF